MRSISASTCAISASAVGVSVVLASSALTTSAPGTATNAAPNIKPATKTFIQRDRDIEALRGPQGERFQRLLELQSAAINRYIGAQTSPSEVQVSQRSVRIATFSLRDDPVFTK